MCCCEKPNVNGQPGYKWQPEDTPRVRHVDPPVLDEGDTLIYDEPGRCGGLDWHYQHFRVVKPRFDSRYWVYVRNGCGDTRFPLPTKGDARRSIGDIVSILETINSNSRFLILDALYTAHEEGGRKATDAANQKWRKAAAEKRIKTRKVRGSDSVKVWIADNLEAKQ